MAYTPLYAEDGTEIFAEDGQTVLAEESTGTGAPEGATGTMALVEDGDTFAASGTVEATNVSGSMAITEDRDTFAADGVAVTPASGDMAVIEPRDTFASSGSVDTSGSMAFTDGADTIAITGTAGTSGSMAIVEAADRISGVGSITVAAPFVPRRPGRIEAPQTVAEKKRILAPVKTLPEPPKEYDPQWMQTLNEALLRHLDATLGASAPNQSVMLRSPGGQVFEITIDDDGKVTSTPKKG